VGGFWRGVSHLRRSGLFWAFFPGLTVRANRCRPRGAGAELLGAFVARAAWKSCGRATALQKFSAVEGWARRRSFVASLLWMTANGGLGGWTGRLGEAEHFVAEMEISCLGSHPQAIKATAKANGPPEGGCYVKRTRLLELAGCDINLTLAEAWGTA
jgi:hypothetical protein